jgi:hypothetical protein
MRVVEFNPDPATFCSDLDRCEHGRHRGDVCGGCRGGVSLGNPLARLDANIHPGKYRVVGDDGYVEVEGYVLGYNISGWRYVLAQDKLDASRYDRGRRVVLISDED